MMYENDEYNFFPNSPSSDTQDIIISDTSQGYAKFISTPLHWTVWTLVPKIDMITPHCTLKAGRWFAYGMYRQVLFPIHLLCNFSQCYFMKISMKSSLLNEFCETKYLPLPVSSASNLIEYDFYNSLNISDFIIYIYYIY